jgi:Ran GTPase-activating protein (RanGAP) involved in mRNA processing and transport
MSETVITSQNCDDVIARIAANDREITEINCRSLSAGKFRALCAALSTNTNVTTFFSGGSRMMDKLGDEGARYLANTLRLNTSITTLVLETNNISSEGAGAIADALATNTTLAMLDLTGNNIRSQGARAIADALATNTTLAMLDLTGNNISSQGARYLADTLRLNNPLITLYLEGNDILPEADKELEVNDILPEAAKEIAEALATNTRLESEEKKSDQQDSAFPAPATAPRSPRLGSNEQERKEAPKVYL